MLITNEYYKINAYVVEYAFIGNFTLPFSGATTKMCFFDGKNIDGMA